MPWPVRHPLVPRPDAATLARVVVAAMVRHLVTAGLDPREAQATVEQAARTEADALRGTGLR